MASSSIKYTLTLDPSKDEAPTRDHASHPESLPEAKHTHTHPTLTAAEGSHNASLFFIGTATTVLEFGGVRLLSDPNFIHAGDHVHLGPGITGTRLTNPAVDLHDLPRVDAVLLSHYHADHFDELVEATLRRSLPIITTPHAKEHLAEKKEGGERFTNVFDLDHFENMLLDIAKPDESGKVEAIKVTGMPGKHVPDGLMSKANELLGAIPPVNGWMVELGSKPSQDGEFKSGYRIYISGDTLFVDDLKSIPERYAGQAIDLMLVHLGGTTIPGPNLPLLMVTMNAEQGIQLMQLIKPELTIPIHFGDYDVFLDPLSNFQEAVKANGLQDKVVYLDRGDQYNFTVKS